MSTAVRPPVRPSRSPRSMVLPVALLAAAVPLVACSPSTPGEQTVTSGDDAACRYDPAGQPARPVDPPSTNDVQTTGETTLTLNMNEGPVTITMDRSATPCTAHSFEALARQGFFDDTQCHRLADSGSFVLQCGDPTGTGRGGPGYRFADEVTSDMTYPAGAVAMANAGPDTNGSQFFLVFEDTQLPPNYTVFGHLDEASLGVVARIAVEGQDGSNPDGTGKPNNEARIIDVTLA
ncbi:MAG: peptidylprolyl isomerase [Propionibacteriaceae bacterium]|nr:peptidylprolyl isomerase [Propionibacteriaceae bacterium]